MIALGLADAEELAEAIYLAEETVRSLAAGGVPRGGLWRDVEKAERTVKVAAARRLIALYRVEGVSLGLLAEPE